jgi:SSS family solute:Na+ symporter
MTMAIVVIVLFMALNVLVALWPATGPGSEAEFALAGRKLSGFTLLATLAASNLSAFTIFGVSGASYRMGWAFFPVMAFGTAFMALSFSVIGVPLRRLSAEHGWTTPGQFIADRYGSPLLGRLFSGLSLAYTIPYLAIQAGAGGRLIAGMTGLPLAVCSALLVGLVAAYVFRGGMRSVARTDIIQLSAMVVLAVAAGIIVLTAATRTGAFTSLASDTERLSRAGVGGTLGWLPLLGYYVLWALADPMFPHFIQRFYAARTDRDLYTSMIAYPLVAVLVFLPVCAIGVLGSVMIPGLQGAASDGIFTLLIESIAGPALGSLFAIAALAALMSTMDSQLLTCASMIGTDFMPVRWRGTRAAAVTVLALAVAAWIVSLRPPATILDFLNKAAFPGYASLAPIALIGIYMPWIGPEVAAAGLLAGTVLVVSQALGIFVPVIPAVLFNLLVQAAIMILALLLMRLARLGIRRSSALALMAGLGFAGLDIWHFSATPRMVGALPFWLYYQIAVTLLLSVGFWWLYRNRP